MVDVLRKAWRGTALAFSGIILVVATVAPGQKVQAEGMLIPISGLDDCVWCDLGEVCVSGFHLARDAEPYEFDEDFTRNGGAHLYGQCETGSCWSKHGPACEDIETLQNEDVEALRVAVITNDAETLGELIGKHPNRIKVNWSRSAIQLTGCTGSVTMHLPASSKLLGAATAAADLR
jgi:hypothetical protein